MNKNMHCIVQNRQVKQLFYTISPANTGNTSSCFDGMDKFGERCQYKWSTFSADWATQYTS